MSENNKSYRIRTTAGGNNDGYINLDVNLLQDYDIFEILSLKIETEGLYHIHTSKYGCLVGRVIANGGVGVPNAKLSVFISADSVDLSDPVFSYLYPYTNTKTKNREHIRYNLLTDQKIDNCHQDIGTFPNKRLVLDDDNYIEIFDKYYKYTTTTNGAGDYMIFGLPVGNNIIHTDLDLSDIGILSQKPRDLFYKGYSATQFENASQFKKDTNLDNLTQVFSQDSSVYVYPFWGDETENEGQIKITRSDVNISYKFEPTCIFIGSIVSDEKSNGISKHCIPHERMGKMDRLTTGHGTIEMIRKTMAGNVESIAIQGNELIDGNGTWCYQIPMNLDYVKTDEYGNLVPTNNTDSGIPTRAKVRFRVSLSDYESDYENSHLVKVLVPNNPTVIEEADKTRKLNYDYEFGSNTSDESYRDLFWNNVYTVKQFIPRIQKGNRQRNKNFTGFKAVNVNGGNNPIPYNNMRVNLTFLFVFQCLIFKSLVMIVKILNYIIYLIAKGYCLSKRTTTYVTLDGGICPNLEGNYVAPGARDHDSLVENTYISLVGNYEEEDQTDSNEKKDTVEAGGGAAPYDPHAADVKNAYYTDSTLSQNFENEDGEKEVVKIYNNEDYFIKCVELQFAMEYEVIQFDFYNDWINGMLYIPRWFAEARRNKEGMTYCGENFSYSRNLVQQCALGYTVNNNSITISSSDGCDKSNNSSRQVCHKSAGRKAKRIFGPKNRGIVERLRTSKGHYAYYLRPSEMSYDSTPLKVNLFATDLVLMGSVNEYNQYGIPTVSGFNSSSYIIPPTTGEIVYDTQEMQFNTTDAPTGDTVTRKLYTFNKVSLSGTTTYNDSGDEQGESVVSELAGIDWGYNPYDTGDSDNTTKIAKQNTGHFLEIGCTYSLTNIKSCVNLSRICEIGSEMSQSHYYDTTYTYLRPSGIIGKREVINDGIRTTFATLNSNGLKTVIDPKIGYLRYDLVGYIPNSFMGDLAGKLTSNEWKPLSGESFGFVDGQSKSYKAFRFGTTDLSSIENGSFLVNGSDKLYYMPRYENSFYFYFGLKNGSTAIDRLYSEYYAECTEDKVENDVVPTLTLTYTPYKIIRLNNEIGKIHYVVEGLGRVEKDMFKIEYYSGGTWITDSRSQINLVNNEIAVRRNGTISQTQRITYRVTIKNRLRMEAVAEVEVYRYGKVIEQ